MLRLDPDEELNLDEQNSITLKSFLTSPQTIIELPTKNYVDGIHEINRNRRYLSCMFIDQDNEFDKNKLTNLDNITVNRNPNSDNELANKKFIDDSIAKIHYLDLIKHYKFISK